MIAPLRRRHRRMITLLAVVVPALFVAGLLARRPLPAAPKYTAAAPTAGLSVRGADSPGAVALDWAPSSARPDVLAYWQPEAAGVADLSPEAILLGKLHPGRESVVELPDAASTVRGRILIYSLAHREVLDSAEVPR